MRIVVTGASGNVGSQLLPQLLAHPGVTEVVGVCRRPPADSDPRVQWRATDLSRDELREVVRGADVVVHLTFLLQPSRDEATMAATNVEGTQRLLNAVARERVPSLVVASSVGAYSPGPDTRVTEDHPTEGVPGSTYSRHKAEVERRLDDLERAHPDLRVVRIRPGLVMQERAASSIARYFLGPFVPQTLVRRGLLPIVPRVPHLAIQAVHAEDAARAFLLAATTDVRGAFNVAAEPVLDVDALARTLHARPVPVPARLVRGLLDLTWRLHLQPTEPGWIDLALQSPLMDTSRARDVLGWTPVHGADEALLDLLDGMRKGSGAPTPVLRPRARGARRVAEGARGLLPGGNG